MKTPRRNKLSIYKALKKDKVLAPYLPDTKKMSQSSLWNFVDKYGEIIAKPRKGRRGKGVIKISSKGNEEYEIHAKNEKIIVKGKKQAYAHIKQYMLPRTYIVQQRIRLIEINGRICDFRVIAQRRRESQIYKITAKVVKLAGKGYVVTNIKGSKGTVLLIEEAIERSPIIKKLSERNLLARIDRIAVYGATKLTKYFRRQRIYGFDMGVDPSGHIWIIEANSDPMMSHFRKLKDKTMYQRIKEYKKG